MNAIENNGVMVDLVKGSDGSTIKMDAGAIRSMQASTTPGMTRVEMDDGQVFGSRDSMESLSAAKNASTGTLQIKPSSEQSKEAPEQAETIGTISPSQSPQFTRTEMSNGDVHYSHDNKLSFIDKGSSIEVKERSIDAVNGAMDLAQGKGWNFIELDGKSNFKAAAVKVANDKGIEVKGAQKAAEVTAERQQTLNRQKFAEQSQSKTELGI